MEYYLLVKNIHLTTALLSFAGFLLRCVWSLTANDLLNHRLVKTLPHINDTLLLTAGVWLVYWGPYSPIAEPWAFPWLIGKWLLLLVYIVAGSYALKRAKTPSGQIKAMIIAWLSVIMIFLLAFYKPSLLC